MRAESQQIQDARHRIYGAATHMRQMHHQSMGRFGMLGAVAAMLEAVANRRHRAAGSHHRGVLGGWSVHCSCGGSWTELPGEPVPLCPELQRAVDIAEAYDPSGMLVEPVGTETGDAMAADEKLVADFAERLLQEGYAVWHEYPDSHDEPDLDAARNLLTWLTERGRPVADGPGEVVEDCGCPITYKVAKIENHTYECGQRQAAERMARHIDEEYGNG